MQPKNRFSYMKNLRYDFPAGIVVFLVSMPLCLGIAFASGAPLFSGIIAGIVGGMVVAVFSDSPLGVSGPAVGLTVIVLGAIQTLGSFQAFLLAVMLAGLIQIILGYIKAGIFGYYLPSAVIKGMLSGIGLVIILKQLPHAFGYDMDFEGSINFAQINGQNTLSGLFHMVQLISPGAILISLVSLAILILWERPIVKQYRLLKLIPGPLVVIIISIIMSLSFQNTSSFALNSNQIVNLPVADNLVGFLHLFTFPDFSYLFDPAVYTVAITIALIASIETVLCVEATEKIDPYRRTTSSNRELKAQGIGNFISGMIGGLPITQVIIRSSANVQSGGRTKASTFIHGALLLLSVMIIPHILNLIPLASLAAILLVIGYRLTKPAIFKEIYAMGKDQFVPFLVTIIGIVFTDLLIGIGLGLSVGIFYILWRNYKTPYHFDSDSYKNGQILIELAEDVSFLNKAGILNTLKRLPNGCHVVIDGSRNKLIHPDVIEIIEDFRRNASTRDIQVEIKSLSLTKQSNSMAQFHHHVVISNAVKK